MSILAALELAKSNVAKFKKAKCMLEFLQHRISNLETMQQDAERLAKEYAESAVRIKATLDSARKQQDGFAKYIETNESTISDATAAEAIAAKIEKLQKQIAELTSKIEVTNVGQPSQAS